MRGCCKGEGSPIQPKDVPGRKLSSCCSDEGGGAQGPPSSRSCAMCWIRKGKSCFLPSRLGRWEVWSRAVGLLNEIYVKPGSTSLSLGLDGQSELRLKGRKRKCQHREGHFLSPPQNRGWAGEYPQVLCSVLRISFPGA